VNRFLSGSSPKILPKFTSAGPGRGDGCPDTFRDKTTGPSASFYFNQFATNFQTLSTDSSIIKFRGFSTPVLAPS
jgi:hypothetical protein